MNCYLWSNRFNYTYFNKQTETQKHNYSHIKMFNRLRWLGPVKGNSLSLSSIFKCLGGSSLLNVFISQTQLVSQFIKVQLIIVYSK